MPIVRPGKLKRGGSPQTRTLAGKPGHGRFSQRRDPVRVARPGRGSGRPGSGQGKRKN